MSRFSRVNPSVHHGHHARPETAGGTYAKVHARGYFSMDSVHPVLFAVGVINVFHNPCSIMWCQQMGFRFGLPMHKYPLVFT